ncbi:hypothetical protein Cni_G17960 [Canna indica]|uniref:ARM repeat superfamily protein n=1 Tax=Canna indica TaxID=4628 RepID=A0AAQ3KID8_9LILI|nr:hypothetical protein Cni_G17960 [Canna indica]
MTTQAIDTIVAERLEKARSDSEEVRVAALQTLSAHTKLSSLNRDLLARSHNALPLLFSLSASASPLTLPLLLSILLHLSLNPNLKQPLASAAAGGGGGFLPRLHSLLSTSPQAASLL